MDYTDLPTDVDQTYQDRAADPSVKAHQQAHDAIHGKVKQLPAVVQDAAALDADTAANVADPATQTGQALSAAIAAGAALNAFGVKSVNNGDYIGPFATSIGGTTTLIEGLLCASPVSLPYGVPNLRYLQFRVATAGAVGSVVRLGLYTDDGAGRPGALIVDAGTVSAETAGFKTLGLAAPESFAKATVLWLGGVLQGGAATAAACYTHTGVAGMATSNASGLNYGGYSRSGVAGALPADFASDGVAVAALRVVARRFD